MVNPISSIQRNQDIDNNMLYNNSVTDNISLNMLKNFINASNLERDNIIIGLLKAIKL